MAELNVALLDKALERITASPERWHQNSFVDLRNDLDIDAQPLGPVELCNTTMCLAGWAMLESGQWTPTVVEKDGSHDIEMVNAQGQTPHDAIGAVYTNALNACDYTIADAIDYLGRYGYIGMQLLGLDKHKAHKLFFQMHGMDPQEFADNVRSYLAATADW